jgi:thioredoxin reductase (NADPH)
MIYDTIIIGSDPAAYQCALYLNQFSTILLEGGYIGNNGPGGQLTTTTTVDNYPAIVKISGPELVEKMKIHCDAKIISETATSIELVEENSKDDLISKINDEESGKLKNKMNPKRFNKIFEVKTENKSYFTVTVVVATGASARRLNVEGTGDDEFWSNGVSSCAVCDGFLFKDKIVAVVGGGDAAMEETLYLSKICKKVFVVHRRNEFRARNDMFERAKNCGNVEFLTPFVLKKVGGVETVEFMEIENADKNGEVMKIDIDGLFFGIGHDPNTGFIKSLDKDNNGYLITNNKMETSCNGVFACGDVQDKKFRQANTAAASGCVAALSVIDYFKNID